MNEWGGVGWISGGRVSLVAGLRIWSGKVRGCNEGRVALRREKEKGLGLK